MATQQNITPSIWQLFKDPALRTAFRRADRDNGHAFAEADPRRPDLDHGAAEKPVERVLELA